MKVRFKYAKKKEVKYISHLDIIRVFDRALRRAKLPVTYTQGYNPRPRMSFGPALPVGATSDSEYIDIEFSRQIPLKELTKDLNASLPPGFELLEATPLDLGAVKLSEMNTARYEVILALGKLTGEGLKKGIVQLLNTDKIPTERIRRGKVRVVDIAPLIKDIKVLKVDGKMATVEMTLAIGQGGSVAVPVVVGELGKILSEEIKIKDFCRKTISIL